MSTFETIDSNPPSPYTFDVSRSTNMSTTEDLKKRMAAILAEATAQNLNLNDVIPSEVQDHFHGVAALRDAKNLIADLEEEKKELMEKTSDLGKQLKEAQQALENIPADQKALKVDLDQANRSVEFYHKLMDAAELRANQYQDKLREALQKQNDVEEHQKKIEMLENGNQALQYSMKNLVKENENGKVISDQMLERKEEKIMALEKCVREKDKVIMEKDETYEKLIEESSALEKQYERLVSMIDTSNCETANRLNITGVHLVAAERLQEAIFAQIQPIRHFYVCANDVLNIYKTVFQQLLNTTEQNVSRLPDRLWENLTAAATSCLVFHKLRDETKFQGVLETTQHMQLTEMVFSAEDMLNSLTAIADDVNQFLSKLDHQPHLWQLIRMKFKNLKP
ncbi:hypothetical protein N0V90_011745 [Kalmusia sp. IMI 367209]|nr:hypothetical protein N0V90_011745 [Kalmusia sp. IMI 367209]